MGNKHSTSSVRSLPSVSSQESSENPPRSPPTSRASRKSHKSRARVPRTPPVPENPSEAILVALAWIKAKKTRNIMTLYSIADQDATFYFADSDVSLDMRSFWDTMMAVFHGFPDLSFSYSDIQEIEPGVVCLINYVGSGHHTGPFEFGDQPVLSPTGAYIADEPMTLTLTVKNGKITNLVAEAHGRLVGPPGFYDKARKALEKVNSRQ